MGSSNRPRRLFVCRHGHRADWLLSDRSLRPEDPGLSERGRAQVSALAAWMRRQEVDHILSSPHRRTVESAEILAAALRLRVGIEPNLGDWLNADWMVRPPLLTDVEELSHEFPSVDTSYRPTQPIGPAFPEAMDIVRRRLDATVDSALAQLKGNILIVGHAMAVIQIAGHLAGVRPDIVRWGTASLIGLEYRTGAWRLIARLFG